MVSLEDSNGIWREDGQEVRNLVEHVFQQLYSTSNPVDAIHITDFIHSKVSTTQNDWLLRVGTEEEIRTALFEMSPLKAPLIKASKRTNTKSLMFLPLINTGEEDGDEEELRGC